MPYATDPEGSTRGQLCAHFQQGRPNEVQSLLTRMLHNHFGDCSTWYSEWLFFYCIVFAIARPVPCRVCRRTRKIKALNATLGLWEQVVMGQFDIDKTRHTRPKGMTGDNKLVVFVLGECLLNRIHGFFVFHNRICHFHESRVSYTVTDFCLIR